MFERTNDSLDGNACSLVGGEISALGHCREFQQRKAEGEDEAISPSDEPEPWAEPFLRARELDRRDYLKGLHSIDVSPNINHWNAHYDADADEIGVQMKLSEKPLDEQVQHCSTKPATAGTIGSSPASTSASRKPA